MYDTVWLLQSIESHRAWFLTLAGTCFVIMFVMFGLWWRSGRRSGLAPVSEAILLWLVTDVWPALGVGIDDRVAGHWFVTALRAGIGLCVLGELAVLYLVVKQSRQETNPHLSPRTYGLTWLAALVLTAAAWAVIKSGLDDGLYFAWLCVTMSTLPPVTAHPMIRRRGLQGVSLLAIDLALLQLLLFFAALVMLGGPFRQGPFITLAAVAVLAQAAVAAVGHHCRRVRHGPGRADRIQPSDVQQIPAR